MSEPESDIIRSFRNKNVFITGATGFLGKVLVEKLLWDCADVGKVYVLLRGNGDREISEKFENYKKNQIFARINGEKSDLLKKLCPIGGDLNYKCLNISDENQAVIFENVNVIFHCAASVKFDQQLRDAVLLNTQGTKELIDLARKIHRLDAFVHVSTAFSNTNESHIREIVYPPLFDYRSVIEICEQNNPTEVRQLDRSFKKVFPNSYVFTKNLAEQIVFDWRRSMPVAIVRPSLVTPSYKEPYPGWVDSYNGPVAVFIAGGAGILRTVHGLGSTTPDLLPVDFAINSFIAVATKVMREKTNDCIVYNCTTSTEAPIKWNDFLYVGRERSLEYPSNQMLWYPGGSFSSNYFMFLLRFVFLQLMPAILVDAVLLISLQKPWLIKMQRKIFASLNLIAYFLKRQWHWENDNFRELFKSLSSTDKALFNFDATQIFYSDYLKDWILGSRKYMLKLDESSLASSRLKLKILYWLDYVVKFAVFVLIGYFAFGYLRQWNIFSENRSVCKFCTKLKHYF